jgi:hypothetical protein
MDDRTASQEMVEKLRHEGFATVGHELRRCMELVSGKRRDKLKQFYQYVYNQQDGLLDMSQRGYTRKFGNLGAIEGNVDKLVIYRMKGRRCYWKLKGARAMLALCQHKDTLNELAFEYLPLEVPRKSNRRSGMARDRLARCEYLARISRKFNADKIDFVQLEY